MLAKVHSCAVVGLDALPVHVEVDIASGLEKVTLVGLPDTAVRESSERVRAALSNSSFYYPQHRLTVNLAPADLPKESGRFDLPIALGLLAAEDQMNGERLADYCVTGELALSGEVRRVRGVLPIALQARAAGRQLRDIHDAVFVGNTTMIHILLGINPQELGGAPFALAQPGCHGAGLSLIALGGSIGGQRRNITFSPGCHRSHAEETETFTDLRGRIMPVIRYPLEPDHVVER